MQLYSYFRSSAAYRVRIALSLKGLPYEYLAVHLLKDGGQQLSADYRQVNPTALVPTLVDGDAVIGQSLAIIEYLEETHPQPPLLPADAIGRARVRDLALGIACDTHPLNNLRVLNYLGHRLELSEDARLQWYRHWVEEGFAAVERILRLRCSGGPFALGLQPTLADVCLIPQVFNARRFDVPLSTFPMINEVAERCETLEAFRKASPEAAV